MPTPLSKYRDGLSFRVDYLLVSPALAERFVDGSVVQGDVANLASDHFSYVVDFE